MPPKNSRKQIVPADQRSERDLYMTPLWLCDLIAEHFSSLDLRNEDGDRVFRLFTGTHIIDLAAGDGRLGRSMTRELGTIEDCLHMLDMNPLKPDVLKIDLLANRQIWTFKQWRYDDAVVISNPPFNLIQDFIDLALSITRAGIVIVIMRCGALQQVGFPFYPLYALLPKIRIQFEITEAYAHQLMLECDKQGKEWNFFEDKYSSTGWTMKSPGEDHGVYLFTRDTARNENTECRTVLKPCKQWIKEWRQKQDPAQFAFEKQIMMNWKLNRTKGY